MSCNHCNTKFSFFHKELGCGNCGLSFCSRCLKQKCVIASKQSNGEQNVCRICYSKLTAGTSATEINPPPPPDSFLRRLEKLENPSAPPITLYQNNSKMQKLRLGLCEDDQKILDRLEKLREDRKKVTPPTETELMRRLANLKGKNFETENTPKQMFLPDVRSDQQKADDLLEQFMSEKDIELAHNPEKEIEARLLRLRENGVKPNSSTYLSSLHDSSESEEDIEHISRKIMDEIALDEKCPVLIPGNSSGQTEEETSELSELPWCVLCNKDAIFRCLDCSNDLYCADCSKEVHKTWGYDDHQITTFKK